MASIAYNQYGNEHLADLVTNIPHTAVVELFALNLVQEPAQTGLSPDAHAPRAAPYPRDGLGRATEGRAAADGYRKRCVSTVTLKSLEHYYGHRVPHFTPMSMRTRAEQSRCQKQ